jgi:homospermidine synthase
VCLALSVNIQREGIISICRFSAVSYLGTSVNKFNISICRVSAVSYLGTSVNIVLYLGHDDKVHVYHIFTTLLFFVN